MKKKFLVFVFYTLLVLFLIALYTIPPALGVPATRFVFAMTGYYLILALLLLWAITLVQCLVHYKSDVMRFFRSYSKGLVVCFMLVCIIFISVKPMFRVLSDETNLLSVSKSMLYEKKADNVIMGKWYYDIFHPVRREVDARPLAFSFLACIIHVLTGFRPENVFVLNFIVLFILLFLIYKVFKDRLGGIWATSAVILVASQPVVSQGATSGGFELLFSLFVIISFISLRWFIDNPEGLRFQLLWANLLFLSNTRYEGIMFFVLVMFGLWCLKYLNNPDFFKKNMQIIYAFTILALLLIWWQRFAMKDLMWVDKINKTFSLNNLPQNISAFSASLFNYHFFFPHATIVNLFAVLSIFYFVYLYISGRLPKEKRAKDFLTIFILSVFVYWIFLVLFIAGEAVHPSTSRYFMIFFILFSVIAAVALSRIKIFKGNPIYALIMALAVFLLYHPVSVEDRYSRAQVTPREFRAFTEFLDNQAKKEKNILVIVDRPNQYTAFNYGAVGFNYANNDKGLPLEYNNHLYSDIFVMQKIDYSTQQPTAGTFLDSKYILEKITELETDVKGFIRISRVVAVKV